MKGRELTRRQILAGAAGAGGTGILVGTGTAAYLADDEVFGNAFVVGTVDLGVDWGGGTTAVEIDESTGSERLTVSLDRLDGRENNPAYVWLRTTCPELPDLADDLDVTLSYTNCGNGDVVIAEGTLLEVANELRTGIPLSPACERGVEAGNQGCLGTDETIDLNFEWELTEPYDGDPSDLFAFEFVGRQCRHNDGGETPFRQDVQPCEEPEPEGPAVSFVEIYAATSDCQQVGKLELESRGCYDIPGIEEDYIEPGTYPLYEDTDGGDDGTCEETGYEIKVTDVETKDGGDEVTAIAFELIDPDDSNDPDLCEVHIKGGREEVVYDDSTFDDNSTDGTLEAPDDGGGPP